VIVGGGFGGLRVAQALRKAKVSVTLLDRQNYHLFQPLLYQVATGGLSPANIATPLRYILRKQLNCEVLLAEVRDFDPTNQRVILVDGELEYDYLVVAAGSTHSYFGHHSWQAVAPGLKTIAEAADIRSRIFLAFEAAEREPDPSRWRELLTFVVVGAGATGVELAGALAEIANQTLRNDFRRINPEDAHILLIEAGPRVLANYSESLSKKAEDSIRKLGIDLRLGTKVVEIGEDHIGLEDAQGPQDIRTRTVLWAAGVQASPLGRSLAEGCQVACDRSGRVPVEPNLSVLGHPNVFVIGDLAACPGANGKPLPGVAPVAIQQGAFVADWLAKRAAGKPTPTAFAYRDRGSMATIGRAAAVAQIGKRRFTGFFAWIMWLLVHLMLIVQFQNRVMVLMQWAWYYLTFNRSARLITTRPDREAPKGPV